MLILIDYNEEENMAMLNNARNNMLDNFKSIKWLFHQIMDFKDKIGTLEGRMVDQRNLDFVEKDSPMMVSLTKMATFFQIGGQGVGFG